ncbi:MCP four helix bundle domain-containing protein, partial [Solimonas soli]|uniref:MCP four helix bundle domain-containing protein n=1 Tax=Solimonas soli TaxID=413479 RepID=UPI0005B9ECD7
MKLIKNLPIATKLLLACLIASTFTVALGGFSLYRLVASEHQVQSLLTNWVPAVQKLMNMRTALSEYRIYQIQLVGAGNDAQLRDDYIARLGKTRTQFDDAFAAYRSTARGEEEAQLSAAVDAQRRNYFALDDALREHVENRRFKEAAALLNGELKAARRATAEAIDKDLDFNSAALDALGVQSSAGLQRSVVMIAVGVIAVLMLSIGGGWLISRSITRPLRQAVAAARAVAEGDFDVQVRADSRDEAGQLLEAMRSMAEMLRRFSAAQQEMARQHELGDLDYRMDAQAFPGTYAQIATQLNELVAAHIAVKLRLAEVISRYAVGDLSVDMDRLPGKKAVLTQAMDTAKQNLRSINEQIKLLTAAAARGDFSVRGDAERFQFEFRNMIVDLNRLMDVSDGSLREVEAVLGALAEGDLNRTIEQDFEGAFARMKDSANATVRQLAQIVQQIQQAAAAINTAAREIAAGNSDLSSRTEQQAASLEETAS